MTIKIAASFLAILVQLDLLLSSGLAAPALRQIDCTEIGHRVAGDHGGQLARTSLETREGKVTCVLVIFIPARNGERPRRMEISVAVQ